MSIHQKSFFIAGNPVLHSMSPELFAAHVEDINSQHLYIRALCSSAADVKLLLDNGFSGCNITAPLKEEVLSMDFPRSQVVEKIKAANIIMDSDGCLVFDNTDIDGVQTAIMKHISSGKGQNALVAGAGGAGRAAVVALQQLGFDVTLVNRTEQKAQYWAGQLSCRHIPFQETKEVLLQSQVFVNTIGSSFAFMDGIHRGLTVLDADYKSSTLHDVCLHTGARFVSGLQWLVYQAIPAFMYFTGSVVSEDVILAAAAKKHDVHLSALFLTGMMKTGKSTTARLLAQMLGYDYADTDEMVQQLAGKSIEKIFADDGEQVFRNYEMQVMQRFSGAEKIVVATGGGSVISEQNRKIIKDEGTGIWLFASPSELAARQSNEIRPLLHNENEEKRLKELLDIRFKDYLSSSHLLVPCEGRSPEQVAHLIKDELKTYVK
jgi:shikimate dehydrogenase